ncbi:MAG: SDR family oxidoreductase [Methanomicrobia archaeon]|nr:SDR family oxidoreductase [Methanomicrobia archaeon]
MFNLKGKTIIITGGAGLLGSTFSKVCAEYGANVVIADIDEEGAGEVIEKIKEKGFNNIIFQKSDITSEEDVQNIIDTALNEFGEIDALLNNAYPRNENYGRKIEEVSFKDFCENVNLHLGGYFLISKKILNVMVKQKHGNIINMASIYGFSAPKFDIYEGTDMTMPVEYAAIKGAIISLTKYLATYFGKYNIRVNAVSPGGVFNNQPEIFVKNYSEKVILGKRMANTNDLIGVLLFLLSDYSSYITGQNIVVDGGFTL